MCKNSKETNYNLPIACLLSDAAQAQRREQLASELFAGVTATHELADGYELVFPGEALWLTRLAEFVNFERVCCPFLTFELLLAPKQGPIQLRIRGGEEIKTFLKDELQLVGL